MKISQQLKYKILHLSQCSLPFLRCSFQSGRLWCIEYTVYSDLASPDLFSLSSFHKAFEFKLPLDDTVRKANKFQS